MAVDVQGADVVAAWVKKAGASFTTVVDREAKLAKHFGVNYVPFSVWIDENGRVVRAPQPANVGDEAQRAAIAAWIGQEDAAQIAPKKRTASASAGFADAEAMLRFSLAAQLMRLGRDREAVVHLKRALGRDQDNWLIRKQIWAIEHPERFYRGNVDFSWQREQLQAERSSKKGAGQ